MAEGIEQTKYVAVFITQKYHDKVNDKVSNDNCKLELGYATITQTNNKMIAIVMEPCVTT